MAVERKSNRDRTPDLTTCATVRRTAVAQKLRRSCNQYISNSGIAIESRTRISADADKPARRVYRSVKVTKHSTIPYARYSFLLCNSNFVLKTRRFYDIRPQKMSWSRGQGSLKVIESGTIR